MLPLIECQLTLSDPKLEKHVCDFLALFHLCHLHDKNLLVSRKDNRLRALSNLDYPIYKFMRTSVCFNSLRVWVVGCTAYL